MNTSDYIDKYFENILSEAEQGIFNDLLQNDAEFKKEFEFQNQLRDTLVLNDREELKNEIKNWDTDSKKRPFKPWLVAASIIILLGTSWQFFVNSSSPSSDQLYTSYFEPYRNIVQPIVRGENKDDIQSKAFEAYETENHESAINYFNEILEETPDQTISFYKANSLLKLNRANEAIKILETNIKNSDSLQDRNLWYLALAYLKDNNINASKKTLKSLLSQSDFKSKEAKALIKSFD